MSEKIKVAVVGARSLVGETLLELLQERSFPVTELILLDEEDYAGERIEFNNKQVKVQDIDRFDFSQVALAFFVTGSELSETYVPLAAKAGCVVIDRSPVFRSQADIPMLIPEVNPEMISGYKEHNIITIPACISTQLAMVLKPLHDKYRLQRIVVSSYQAVSGAGRAGLEELGRQTAALLNFQELKKDVFDEQISFNIIPQIGVLGEDGSCEEEQKLIDETRRLFNDDELSIHVTTVRVPVFYCHALAVNVQFHETVSLVEAKQCLSNTPGIEVQDNDVVATPVSDAVGQDNVQVSRLRQQYNEPASLDMWIMTDNLRKGAALNAIQVAELWGQHAH